MIVNALVREESGTCLVVVRQAAPGDSMPRWALPGGKVGPGETVHGALARELHEETGLAYTGDVAHAYTVHYLVPDGTRAHAIVHVFDGQGSGVTASLGGGAMPSPDPDGDVQVVEMVPLRLTGSVRYPSRWCGSRCSPTFPMVGRRAASGPIPSRAPVKSRLYSNPTDLA